MQKNLPRLFIFSFIAFVGIIFLLQPQTVYGAFGDAPWNYNGSNIYYNNGNVGIGTTNPPDALTVNTTNTGNSFLSNVGKAYIGEGTGSWWILGGKGTDGRGYNNIATNAFITDTWYRRDLNKEAWILSNYVTENNSGYYKIFHSDPQSQGKITNLRALFSLDSLGNLFIDGSITAKQIKVKSNVWADYVFEDNYNLKPLSELENYIQENKHLPNVPSAYEIGTNGLSVGEVQKVQMEKIEELTLYVIQLQKEINDLKAKL